MSARSVRAWAVTIAAVAAAVLIRIPLYPLLGDTLPFLTLFAAVAISVWAGGALHAVFASVVGYLCLGLLLLKPDAFVGFDAPKLVSLGLYLVTCSIVIAFGERMRRAQRQSHEAEAVASEQRNLLRLTLASIGDAVITTDAVGCVTYINPVATTLTGWGQDEARETPLSQVFHVIDEQTREPVENLAEKVMEVGKAFQLGGNTVLVGRDGTERKIDESAAPITDGQGSIVGVVLVFHDITERRQVEEQFRRTQQELTDFFENAAVGMHWMGPDGAILRVNQTELALLGYTADEYLGHNIAEFHTDPSLAAHMLRRLARGEAIIDQEAQLRCKDGTTRTVLIHANVYQENGRFIHTRTLTHDITALKKAQEALRQSEERLRLAQSVARIGTFEWDIPNDIVSWTPELEAMYGLPPGRFGRSRDEWLRMVHPDDREEFTAKLAESLETGHFECESRIVWPDGTERWVAGRASVFRGAAGNPGRMVGINIDITELKRAEGALREADRHKDEFLATLAHELRNPLAPVRTSLEVMKQAHGNAAMIEEARLTMERQVGQLVRLIDDLLDVSRITRDRLELRKERVELASTVHHAVEACRPLLEQSGHDFSFSLPTEPVYLLADPVRLAQVFGNLLTNACKYTQPGGSIGLTVAREGGQVVAKVRDTGIGIPKEMLPRVFDMFTQVDHSLTSSQGGLGIGLALVKRLVELHGGSVTATSLGAGQGSEFVVRLPVDTPPPPLPVPTVSAEGAAGDRTSRRILVVDDNVDAARSLEMLLRLGGDQVEMAHAGPSALERATELHPDVILLDIGLPGMNGYDVCRAIREQPWGDRIVMVALTGWGQEDDRRKSREAGFDMHLVKPVAPATLRKLLAEL